MPRDIAYWDLRHVAYHEVAHYVAALHFGIPGEPVVTPQGKATLDSRAFTGRFMQSQPTTPFRGAVICWAGPMAGLAVDESKYGSPILENLQDEQLFLELLDLVYDSDEFISGTDMEGIRGHRQVYRSGKKAAEILVKRFSELERKAEELIEIVTLANPDARIRAA